MSELVQVTVHADEAILGLRNAAKRMAYAASIALNNTTLRAQAQIVGSAGNQMQIRKPDFINKRLAKIDRSDFAIPSRLATRIHIDTNVKGSPLLLPTLEQGGTKLPTKGAGIAEPVLGSPARTSFVKSVPTGLYYQNLHLQESRGRIKRGARRTYLIPGVGVFIRLRNSKSRVRKESAFRSKDDPDTTLLYGFHPSAPIKKRLSFIKTATEVAERVFPEEFDKQIKATLAFHGA